MADNFDLKKFLTENKTMESSNPYLKEDMKKESLRKKIREMIIKEIADYADYDEMDDEGDDELSYIPSMRITRNPNLKFDDIDDTDPYSDNFDPYGEGYDEFEMSTNAELTEAEEETEEEETEEDTTEEEGEEVETEEGDIDITDEEGGEEGDMEVPEMEGDEGEILTHLMQALKGAKATGDDKLTKQIGNTVTFLTRQYISSESGE